MKKYLYFAATAALVLASCSSDVIGVQDEPTPVQPITEETEAIAFGSMTKRVTRANEHVGSDAATLLDNNFVVMGVKGGGAHAGYALANEVFDHYNVNYTSGSANTTLSNTNDWEYVNQDLEIKGVDTDADGTFDKLSAAAAQTIKYWDFSTSQYDYVAVSLGKGVGATPTYAELSKINYNNIGKAVATGEPVYTLTGTAEELASAYIADLVTLYNRDGQSDYKNAVVTPKFRALGTKVRIAFYETVPGYAVSNVKFYDEAWDGSVTTVAGSDAPTLFTASDFFMPSTGDGTMEVYYPTVGFDKRPGGASANSDYNKAHIVYKDASTGAATLEKTKTFEALNYTADVEIAEKCTNVLGRTSVEATYAGDGSYDIVIPQGSSENLQLRIEYDLYPIDGGNEVIHVRDARAVVPAEYADWQPNYAYTYIFKISETTNGYTGLVPNPDYDPEDPDSPEYIPEEGLTPITFDAVVVDTEDGIQETITTIATPSITTYQKGKVVTVNNEYVAGDIYSMVMNGTTPVTLTATNCCYYEITAGDAIASEALVEAMLNGTKHDTGITLASKGVTIVDKIPGVDGNDIAVSAKAAKLEVFSGRTYVFNYSDGSKNHVKIIKVQ